MHSVGKWERQKGCTFSQSCGECRDTDTLQGALRRQREAAGSMGVKKRRLVLSVNGDMKGLFQIAGMSAQGVFNCIFCLHQKNGTSVAGIPCLRHPPEGPWTTAHLARDLEVRDPPPRAGTDDMALRAAAYQRDAAAHKAAAKLSSGQPLYQSCEEESMFWSDDLVEHVSKMPLHVLIGIANNRLNRLEEETLKLDENWALNDDSGSGELIRAWHEANVAVAVAEEGIASIQEEITTHESAMLECQAQEPGRKEWDRGAIPAGDKGVWKRRYREEKEAKAIFEGKIRVAKKNLEKLKAEEDSTKAAALAAASTGPFASELERVLLKEIKISKKKYFGGTYEGPSADRVFSSRENISKLCAVLRRREVRSPDGVSTTWLGSDERAAAVESVLQAFGGAYRLFSKKDALCEHEITLFPKIVERFMVCHAEVYPDEQPTPKMHVLGFHYAEMMERHGSTGQDSEQGIEALHPEFNYVLNHFRALDRNKPAQLEAVAGRMWSRGAGAAELKAANLRDRLQNKNERSRERNKRHKASE
jgi:hypothetical protein